MSLLAHIQHQRNTHGRGFALLLDPDEVDLERLPQRLAQAEQSGVHYIFVGGSLVTSGDTAAVVQAAKAATRLPVLLFPGHAAQVVPQADALLYLSLISGRNPEYLIGQHVASAHRIKQSGIEVIPTGYMLIDGGRPTSVSYISNTQPIPADKPDIAAATALAGTLMGQQLIYMDAGSGAQQPVSAQVISRVRKEIDVPLIVGGGIRTPEAAASALQAGADVVVVGNALEPDASDALMNAMAGAIKAI
ncbi:MAG: geranylgeranylglyceryl/heptaprenylglyceryl phosphate synthase [Bacteroidota bacterium]